MKIGFVITSLAAICVASPSFAATQWNWSIQPTALVASGQSEESFSVFIKVQNSPESSAPIKMLGFNLTDGSFGNSAGVFSDSAGNSALVAVITPFGPSPTLNPGEEVSWNAFNIVLYPTYEITGGIARKEQFTINPNFYVQVTDESGFHIEKSIANSPLTVMLSPVPESDTGTLMLLGLVGVGAATSFRATRKCV